VEPLYAPHFWEAEMKTGVGSNNRDSVHSHFSNGNTFLLVGIALVSALLATKTAFFSPPSFVTAPAVAVSAFVVTALCATLALKIPSKRSAYTFYRDGLPFLLFPFSLLVSGSSSRGILVMLLIAVVANVFFLFANQRYDEVDEEKQLFRIYFRWPF
jgi:hypothetical protein